MNGGDNERKAAICFEVNCGVLFAFVRLWGGWKMSDAKWQMA
jgi:hypothetical protein